MAPSEIQIIAAIHTTIEEIYSVPENENNLTVRIVRDTVESKLGLEKGFFTQAEWKDKSKKLIKEYAVCHPTPRMRQLLTCLFCSKN
jgi:hypothetical protein